MAAPQPAATVVLLRPERGGRALEVLLTHRPATMVFAGDMHVFPGGRVDPADADRRLVERSAITPEAAAVALGGDLAPEPAHAAYVAAIRESFEEAGVLLADHPPGADLVLARARLLLEPGAFPEIAVALDLRLRTDRLVPLSRWVTPPGLSRRFDARFFAAAMPKGSDASLAGIEVVSHAWYSPLAALEAMADGGLGMWLPTSTTLQQLAHVRRIDEIRDRMAPGVLGEVAVDEVTEELVRIEMPAGGGVAGQPVHAYLVGRRDLVLIDPGDPTGTALDRAVEEARRRGGRIRAIALTHADPDHAAGAEALRDQVGGPVYVGPGGGRHLPYESVELVDGATISECDIAVRAVATPGPRPDHLAFLLGDGELVISGDLDGVRGRRSILAPPDDAAWRASEGRLRAIAPGATWLGGHPAG